MTTMKLNETETAVFKAICDAIQQETGGQFGWSDDIKRHLYVEMTKGQMAGYCSQLEQKGLYGTTREDGFTMIFLNAKGIEYARSIGDERRYEEA